MLWCRVLAYFNPQWPKLIFAVAYFENENVSTLGRSVNRTLVSRFWRLVCFTLGIFNRRTNEQRIANGVPEIEGSHCGHSQMGNRDNFRSYTTISDRFDQVSGEHDVNKTTVVPKCRAKVEVNNRGLSQAVNWDECLRGGRWGLLCHDGSYSMFEWDSIKGCMVPFEMSNPDEPPP
jgi:hypothetical protein